MFHESIFRVEFENNPFSIIDTKKFQQLIITCTIVYRRHFGVVLVNRYDWNNVVV